MSLLAIWLLFGCGKISTEPNLQIILADKPAKTLSAYGLMQKGGGGFTPVHSIHAYDLINSLFTDYAAKQRFVFVPKGGTAQYSNEDVLTFPVGSVLIKNFGYAPDMRVPDKDAYLVETRLLIHKKSGWVAYPYVWDAKQSEAAYAPVGKKVNVKTIAPNGESLDFIYAVPNVNQCKTCHQSGHDIIPIGPKPRNLNHKNQLQNWAELGILDPAVKNVAPVAKVFDPTFSLGQQARAYLDINCAHCHKADGSASNSGLWLNLEENTLVRLGINKHPTAAGRGAGGFIYVIEAGAPQTSILPYRMNSNEAGVAMPELGRSLAHKEGVELINAWIAQMPE
ncbi:MAG: hypothetical protein JKX72_01725 [Robiginitomaculum sp.]|nr:hypothetical protein [Robiginitomaculum sp.]